MPDAHANFAVSAVATAPSPASSGTSLVVTTGHGTRFPAVPFNAVVCPAGTQPDPTNAEIVRVTAISTDTLTITRAQESSSARSITVGDQIFAAVTKKTLTDIEGLVIPPGTETVYAVSGTTPALSPANGTIQTWTLSGNSTPTAGTWNAGESITIMIDDGTAYTITWTSVAVTWVGGVAPTLATTGYTIIELFKVGSTIYGCLVGSA